MMNKELRRCKLRLRLNILSMLTCGRLEMELSDGRSKVETEEEDEKLERRSKGVKVY
jgi:hypothetical protein